MSCKLVALVGAATIVLLTAAIPNTALADSSGIETVVVTAEKVAQNADRHPAARGGESRR